MSDKLADDQTAVRVSGLSFSYRSRRSVVQAVRGLTFDVPMGEVVSIVGSSGAGKSTLLHMLARLITPDAGLIEYPAFAGMPRIGYMFQSKGTFPWRTVERNLTYAMEIRGASQQDRKTRAIELCSMVGLIPEEHLRKYPNELSGGQLRRVELAMAFAETPQLLLVDEPTSAVDWLTRRQLQRKFQEVVAAAGITVIAVTHDIEESVWLSDRVIALEHGLIADSVDIPCPRPRTDDLRTTESFRALEDRVIRALTNGSASASNCAHEDLK
jgi:ABC-type nitrate/sulfonate/bicarbonate transport system ATPase subunit